MKAVSRISINVLFGTLIIKVNKDSKDELKYSVSFKTKDVKLNK